MTIRIAAVTLIILAAFGSFTAIADSASDLAKARASDPATLGWMVGVPPPADKVIRYSDSQLTLIGDA